MDAIFGDNRDHYIVVHLDDFHISRENEKDYFENCMKAYSD